MQVRCGSCAWRQADSLTICAKAVPLPFKAFLTRSEARCEWIGVSVNCIRELPASVYLGLPASSSSFVHLCWGAAPKGLLGSCLQCRNQELSQAAMKGSSSCCAGLGRVLW